MHLCSAEAQKEADDAILARAKAIRRVRYQKSWQPSAEPKREKEHWDFLLDEMQWMAKEFARFVAGSGLSLSAPRTIPAVSKPQVIAVLLCR